MMKLATVFAYSLHAENAFEKVVGRAWERALITTGMILVCPIYIYCIRSMSVAFVSAVDVEGWTEYY